MKKLSVYLGSLAMVLAAVVSCGNQAYAEETQTPSTWLQISPTAVTVTLKGGDQIEGDSEQCPDDLDEGCAIEIKNIGTKPFRYKVYASPYVIKGEQYELSFSESASTSYTQISRWITFLGEDGEYAKEVELTINPNETQVVHYRIDVPEDAPGGSQYAVIWAQTLGGDADASGVQTISQAGMVVSGRSIGNTNQSGDVDEYYFTRFSIGGSLEAKALVKNTGNTDFDAYYSYTARTLFGKELYVKKDAISTFPDTDYHISLSWDEPPLMGIFQVEFRVIASNTDRQETHIVIIMPIFVIILLILLLTVIIVWIIIIIRKRKERKARTLV